MTDSPLALAVDRIGDRWTILIVDALMTGPLRFGEIERLVEGIAPTVLTKRIRQLESDGIVTGRPYSLKPVRLAYELTGPGRALADAIGLLAAWGASHSAATNGGESHGAMHRACGSPVTTRLWCSTCDRPVGHADASDNIAL